MRSCGRAYAALLAFALVAFCCSALPLTAYAVDQWEMSWAIGGDSRQGEDDFQYSSATWFYQFTGGNYTGTDAACGVDISSHNGDVNWKQLAAEGVDFAIIRCGYGDNESIDGNQDDTRFLTNYRAAKAAGVKVGVYIYSYAINANGAQKDAQSAESEALHVLRILKDAGISPSDLDYPIYWDVEDPTQVELGKAGALVGMANTFCEKIQQAGYDAGIYSSKSWWDTYLNSHELDGYYKWVAQWDGQSDGLTYSGCSDFRGSKAVWQFSARGYSTACSGHGHRVDLNYSYYQQPMPRNSTHIDTAGLTTTGKVYVDGVAYTPDADGVIILPNGNAKTAVAYSYNTVNGDVNTQYPTHMYVWTLSYNGRHYIATRQTALDDALRYAGCSIRITGTKGIRMITDVSSDLRKRLIDGSVGGYSLVEYGTVVARDSKLKGADLVLGLDVASSGVAYLRGQKDAIFANEGNMVEFTNVLVGFNLDDCKETLAMRPYMKLKDASGNVLTLYGGTLHKSIGYIAKQNANDFPAGSDAYNYIHEIINYVYG